MSPSRHPSSWSAIPGRPRAAPLARTGLALLAVAAVAGATTWNVSSVTQLHNAVNGAGYNDEIIIAPGTYNLSQELVLNDQLLTIRGQSGNRDDVTLVGSGFNTMGSVNIGMHVYSDNITIRDLTLTQMWHHAVQIHGEFDVDGTTISNVKTLNIGTQHIKGSTNFGNASAISDNGVIQHCHMENTQPRSHGDEYTAGIDILGANNWRIHDNFIKNVYGDAGAGGAAIFVWQGVKDCVTENNVIVGSGKGISYGIPGGGGHAWMPGLDIDGGIIRNNFVLRGTHFDNIALEVSNAKNLKVYNNTVYSGNASYFRAVHIYGANTTGVDSRYNIIRGKIFRNGADWSETGNIVDTTGATAVPGWFVDVADADFHLTALAAGAIDQGLTLGEVPADIDGDARPFGAFPDVGADEYVPEPCSAGLLVLGLCALVKRRRP